MIKLRQLRVILTLLMLSLLVSAAAFCQTGAQNSADLNCERLAQLKLPATTITLAKLVPAGTFSGPPALYTGMDLTPFYKTLPAFCRVVAQATPTADSDIKLEVWMPATAWNGKLQGIGNGGFAGQIDYAQLGNAVQPRICRHGHRHRAHRHARRRSMGAGTSREGDRFRSSRCARNDAHRQGRHQRILRTQSRALVLLGLLGRRPRGLDGGATLSRRLRRHSGRSARKLLDSSALLRGVEHPGTHHESCQFHSAGENSRYRERCARRLRFAGRRTRWSAQRSPQVSLRSGIDALQERRGYRQLPHFASSSKH